jgi:transcriptional regulator
MTVEEIEGSFKLNQHKSETDYAAIAGALAAQPAADARAIAELMRVARPLAFAAVAVQDDQTITPERSA